MARQIGSEQNGGSGRLATIVAAVLAGVVLLSAWQAAPMLGLMRDALAASAEIDPPPALRLASWVATLAPHALRLVTFAVVLDVVCDTASSTRVPRGLVCLVGLAPLGLYIGYQHSTAVDQGQNCLDWASCGAEYPVLATGLFYLLLAGASWLAVRICLRALGLR